MKMVDMAQPKEMMGPKETTIMPMNQEKYPWGLRITLNSNELAKLGIDLTDYKIDDSVEISCHACVTRMSMNQSDNGEDSSMELQIEKMAIANKEDYASAFKDAIDED